MEQSYTSDLNENQKFNHSILKSNFSQLELKAGDESECIDLDLDQNFLKFNTQNSNLGKLNKKNSKNDSKEIISLNQNEKSSSSLRNQIPIEHKSIIFNQIRKNVPKLTHFQFQNSTVLQSQKNKGHLYSDDDIKIKSLDGNLKQKNLKMFNSYREEFKDGNNKPLSAQWKKSGLTIIVFLMIFMNNIKTFTPEYRLRFLDFKKFRLINDYSADYEYFKYNYKNHIDHPKEFYIQLEKFKLFLLNSPIYKLIASLCCWNKISQQLNNISVIHPDSKIKIMWDSLILILLTMNIFYIPVKITYEATGLLQIPDILRFLLDDIPAYSFLIDTLLNFNTACYKKGYLITNRRKIIKRYLKKDFIFDVLIIGPYFISKIFNIFYLDIILLMRTNKIYKMSNELFDFLNPNESQQSIYDLCKIIIFILFSGHFFGCALSFLAYKESGLGVQTTWLDNYTKNPGERDWLDDYTSSVYWAVITMITVGYGDIVPITQTERFFLILLTILSCGIFAYSVNSIGSIISTLTKDHREFKLKMFMLTNFMKERNLSKDLQMNVKKYFEHLHYDKSQDTDQCNLMINQLVGRLKKQVILDIYYKILMSKKLFSLHFSKQFCETLALNMKEQQFGPDHVIFDMNNKADRLFFLMSGEIDLYAPNSSTDYKNTQTVIKTIKNDKMFNEWSFISDKYPQIMAITKNVVSVAYITKEDFLKFLEDFPEDYEKFCKLRDKICIYNTTRGMGIKCQICQNFSHRISNCPYVNFVPDYDRLTFQFLHSNELQERKSYERQDLRIQNTLLNADVIRGDLIRYLVEKYLGEDEDKLQNQDQILTEKTIKEQQEILQRIDKIMKASVYFQDYTGNFTDNSQSIDIDLEAEYSDSYDQDGLIRQLTKQVHTKTSIFVRDKDSSNYTSSFYPKHQQSSSFHKNNKFKDQQPLNSQKNQNKSQSSINAFNNDKQIDKNEEMNKSVPEQKSLYLEQKLSSVQQYINQSSINKQEQDKDQQIKLQIVPQDSEVDDSQNYYDQLQKVYKNSWRIKNNLNGKNDLSDLQQIGQQLKNNSFRIMGNKVQSDLALGTNDYNNKRSSLQSDNELSMQNLDKQMNDHPEFNNYISLRSNRQSIMKKNNNKNNNTGTINNLIDNPLSQSISPTKKKKISLILNQYQNNSQYNSALQAVISQIENNFTGTIVNNYQQSQTPNRISVRNSQELNSGNHIQKEKQQQTKKSNLKNQSNIRVSQNQYKMDSAQLYTQQQNYMNNSLKSRNNNQQHKQFKKKIKFSKNSVSAQQDKKESQYEKSLNQFDVKTEQQSINLNLASQENQDIDEYQYSIDQKLSKNYFQSNSQNDIQNDDSSENRTFFNQYKKNQLSSKISSQNTESNALIDKQFMNRIRTINQKSNFSVMKSYGPNITSQNQSQKQGLRSRKDKENDKNQKNQFFILPSLDKMKIWKSYFLWNNYNIVLSEYNSKQNNKQIEKTKGRVNEIYNLLKSKREKTKSYQNVIQEKNNKLKQPLPVKKKQYMLNQNFKRSVYFGEDYYL